MEPRELTNKMRKTHLKLKAGVGVVLGEGGRKYKLQM